MKKKRFIAFLIVVLLVITACGSKKTTAKPEDVAKEMLDAVFNLDIKKAKTLTSKELVSDFPDDEKEKEKLKPIFDSMNFNILSSEVVSSDEEKARVKIVFTTEVLSKKTEQTIFFNLEIIDGDWKVIEIDGDLM